MLKTKIMKKILLLVAFLSATFIGARAQGEHYYYYKGEKVYLPLDKGNVNIITSKDFQSSSISGLKILCRWMLIN